MLTHRSSKRWQGARASTSPRDLAVGLATAALCGGAAITLLQSDRLLLALVGIGVVAVGARTWWTMATGSGRRAWDPGARLDSFPWWMNPAWQVSATAGLTAVATWAMAPSTFVVEWGTPKALTTGYLLLSLALIGSFVAGVIAHAGSAADAAKVTTAAAMERVDVGRLHTACTWLFWLTVGGYVAWFAVGVLNGVTVGDILAVLEGRPGAIRFLKERIQPVAGLTTFTQIGPPAVVALYILQQQRPQHQARCLRRIVVIFAFSAVRAVLHAERLAMLEVLVPFATIWLATRTAPAVRSPKLRQLRRALLPAGALGALVVLFGALEYTRSWTNYHQLLRGGTGYVDFVTTRLAGYYATAANNTVVLIQRLAPELDTPFYVVEAFWRFPLVSALGGYPGPVNPDDRWKALLQIYANPEFNNQGGLLLPVADLGVIGALIFWFALGCIAGVAYAHLRRRTPIGLFVTPVLMIGYLEVPRFLYWTLGRALPAIAVSVLLARYVTARSSHAGGVIGLPDRPSALVAA